MKKMLVIVLCFVLFACSAFGKAVKKADSGYETAIFAGGCFWCVQPVFDFIKGVVKTETGYTGGDGDNPTYYDYASKKYVEAVRVIYDPKKTSYSSLLDAYWKQIDPTDSGGQFVDRGIQYRPVIFYTQPDQKKLAEMSKESIEKSGKFKGQIVVEILKAGNFYRAEDVHQEYYKTHAVDYGYYRDHSGRDSFITKEWGSQYIVPLPLGNPPLTGEPQVGKTQGEQKPGQK